MRVAGYNPGVGFETRPPLPIAVLISGSGSTLKNLLERIDGGRLNARVCGVAASRDCSGLQHAADHNVPHVVVPRGKPFDAGDFSQRLTGQIDEWQPELIVFGGFLSLYIIPPQYRHRVINVHPALLPAFGGRGMYGDRVHEAVLASGTKISGCSVHFVDDEYDHGAIIAQKAVAVLDGDTVETLGERVRTAERELYPLVIQWFADGRVTTDSTGEVKVAGREKFLT
jgi:phosphoribosylglycinamide formyltransferase-1